MSNFHLQPQACEQKNAVQSVTAARVPRAIGGVLPQSLRLLPWLAGLMVSGWFQAQAQEAAPTRIQPAPQPQQATPVRMPHTPPQQQVTPTRMQHDPPQQQAAPARMPHAAQDAAARAPARFPIANGAVLQRGARVPSASGRHYLIFQPDGNLVVYDKDDRYVWGLDRLPNYQAAAHVRMEHGDLTVKDANQRLLWSAMGNSADPQAHMDLTPEGALQLVSPQRGILWASDGKRTPTPASAPPPVAAAVAAPTPAPAAAPAQSAAAVAARLPLTAGMTLQRGMKYPSPSGKHTLVFAEDGNIIVSTKGGEFVWGVNNLTKNFSKNARVGMDADGRFAAVDAAGNVVWAPLPSRDPGAQLTVNSAGALQLIGRDGRILWSSDGNLVQALQVMAKTNAKGCAPEKGWSRCIELSSPRITIQASAKTSELAMHAVANVYQDMFSRLHAKYQRSTFDGFKVYMTNGEPWTELAGLAPVGTMWPDATGPKSGNFLRGGASRDFLWIEEQMICKQGVKTRNQDYAAGRGGAKDEAWRTYDQVVHEMTHSIEMRYQLEKEAKTAFGRHAMGHVEGFPWSVQAWFNAPSGKLSDSEKRFLQGLFMSQSAYSCDGYKL